MKKENFKKYLVKFGSMGLLCFSLSLSACGLRTHEGTSVEGAAALEEIVSNEANGQTASGDSTMNPSSPVPPKNSDSQKLSLSPKTDSDGDGIVDALDNCTLVANIDQRDANQNGIGDLCEAVALPIGQPELVAGNNTDISVSVGSGNNQLNVSNSAGTISADAGNIVDTNSGTTTVEVSAPANGAPLAPAQPLILSISNAAQLDLASALIQASNFISESGAAHLSSDWEIYNANGGEVIWQAQNDNTHLTSISLNQGSFVNSLAGLTALQPGTQYRVRVRYQDGNHQFSAYSEPVSFTTTLQLETPIVDTTLETELPQNLSDAPPAGGVSVDLNSGMGSNDLTVNAGETQVTADVTEQINAPLPENTSVTVSEPTPSASTSGSITVGSSNGSDTSVSVNDQPVVTVTNAEPIAEAPSANVTAASPTSSSHNTVTATISTGTQIGL